MGVARGLQAPAVPPGTGRVLGAVAAVALLVLVALGVAVADTSTPFPIDDAVLDAAGGWSPELWPTALPIDFFGEPLGVAVLATVVVAACLLLARWRLAVLTVAGQGAVWAASAVVKPVFDRTIHGAHFAYPSGHTAGATAFALVVGLLVVGLLRLGRAGSLLVTFGVALVGGLVAAWAQTVLGAHYATDTLGGLCLALAVVPPLALLVDRLSDGVLGRFSPTGPEPSQEDSSPPVASAAPPVTSRARATTYGACDQEAASDR
jgi:undecaprenyl-diphosphatase